MKKLVIELPDKDYSIIERVAKDQDRRLTDLSYLVYARGLESYFCETAVSIKREPDEYTEEEQAQLKKNAELEKTEGWDKLDYEERQAKGMKHVCDWITNHSYENGKCTDPLFDPLTARFKTYAIEGIKNK